MSYFIGSLHNEWVKRKKRILFILITMLIFFIGFLATALLNDRFAFIPSSSKSNVMSEADSLQSVVDERNRLRQLFESTPSEDTWDRKQLKAQIEWYTFHIDNHIDLNRSTTTHKLISSMTGVYIAFLFPILIIFIGADIFSGELSSGTIKSMLLRPVRRHTILNAKIALVVICSVSILFLSYLCTYLLSIRNGWGDWTGDIALQLGTIYAVPIWLFVLAGLALNLISIVAIAAVIVCISYFIRNLALSIVVSMIAIVLTKILLSPFQNSIPIQKYYFMRHIDLVSHLNITFKGEGTMVLSIIVLLSTTFICYGLVWFRIRKEDLPY
ncbi:ABC transporter permease [Paenibacillus sp. TAF43_2]|uniref:ABC transporter permease n=1 Tax=Paenibacillus sp. TAF43_2 TaxID=3233069 RepID=UPI003F997D34